MAISICKYEIYFATFELRVIFVKLTSFYLDSPFATILWKYSRCVYIDSYVSAGNGLAEISLRQLMSFLFNFPIDNVLQVAVMEIGGDVDVQKEYGAVVILVWLPIRAVFPRACEI